MPTIALVLPTFNPATFASLIRVLPRARSEADERLRGPQAGELLSHLMRSTPGGTRVVPVRRATHSIEPKLFRAHQTAATPAAKLPKVM